MLTAARADLTRLQELQGVMNEANQGYWAGRADIQIGADDGVDCAGRRAIQMRHWRPCACGSRTGCCVLHAPGGAGQYLPGL